MRSYRGQGVEDAIRIRFADGSTGVVAVGNRPSRDAGIAGGSHVSGRVAQMRGLQAAHSELLRHMAQHARVGLLFRQGVAADQEIEVDSVVGAYMQVRREAIEAVGLLDESFFMYGEDLDWAYRIKKAGWKVFYHPQVTVKHIKRAASRQSQKAQFEFQRAMLIFYRKHYQASTPWWLHSLVMAGLLLKGGRGLLPELRQPLPSQL